MSPFAAHVNRWSNCRLCDLCLNRKNVVLARGVVPAQVVMIGEAPGESEDIIGQPFVGPAGKLLSRIVQEAIEDSRTSPSIAWTNVIACIPKDDNTKRKNVEPLPHEIEACAPRLKEFIALCKPQLVVCVGEVAKKEVLRRVAAKDWLNNFKLVHIIHPAAILHAPTESKGLVIKRCRIDLTDAFSSLE